MKLKTLLFVLLFLLTSCYGGSGLRQLRDIESILQENPDSALTMLQELDKSTIRSSKETAYYALLTSAALDKNYIDVSSDTLINKAVKYYSIRNDIRHRMMAYYYQGLVHKNADMYNDAVISMEKAETDALALNDDFYLGLIYRNKSIIFNNTNNNPGAIENIKKAISHFSNIGKERYVYYAKLDLAIFYDNDQNYEAATNCISEIKKYPEIESQCMKLEAGIAVKQGKDPRYAISLYKKIPDSSLNLHDCALYALALQRDGDYKQSDHWITTAYARCKNEAGKANVDYIHAQIEALRGHNKRAFELTRHASHVQDSVTREILRQSVSNAQRDYYKTESLLQEEKNRRLHDRNVFIHIVCILVMALITLVSFLYYQNNKNKAQEQMLTLISQQQQLEETKKNNAALIGLLFREKLNHLDSISDSYLKAESEKERYQAFKEFKLALAAMRKDEDLFASLERDLNLYCNNIMEKLNTQVPGIKGENRKTIMLFFAGLPYDSVQLILNKNSIDSLRTARSRFRKDIKDSQAPDAGLFLEMLEVRKNFGGKNEQQ